MQLGHGPGERCPFAHSAPKDFVVLDSNGIHLVDVQFCGCSTAAPHYIQLLRLSWYPGTPLNPNCAITFSLLRLFHHLSCVGKLPAWDLWKALKIMTQNRTEIPPPDRYRVLLRCMRQFRHLKWCKRGGRGNDPSGIEGTKQGELAVICPACPVPGRNLPVDWATSLKWCVPVCNYP